MRVIPLALEYPFIILWSKHLMLNNPEPYHINQPSFHSKRVKYQFITVLKDIMKRTQRFPSRVVAEAVFGKG